MESIKIFSTQRIDRRSVLLENDIITPVRCGAVFDKREGIKIQGDDEGENISNKRMMYCELTTQYWAWKNVDADYYGFCHYRRYFSFADERMKTDNWRMVKRPKLDVYAISEMCATPNQIKKKVLPYDIIMPVATELKPLMIRSVYEQYRMGEHLYIEDLELIINIIQQSYPKYLPAAEEYIYGSKAYFFNMFIMRKSLFFSYSKWLFSILDDFEHQWKTQNYSAEALRTPGHIAERLLGIYFTWLQQQNKYRIGELQTIIYHSTEALSAIGKERSDRLDICKNKRISERMQGNRKKSRSPLRNLLNFLLPISSQRREMIKRLYNRLFYNG